LNALRSSAPPIPPKLAALIKGLPFPHGGPRFLILFGAPLERTRLVLG
jgi:hypothetical protein